jgi:peptidoglycan/LPS O-acetylase OafA/YrhL
VHLPVLDGVRGVAIMLVLAHHMSMSLGLEFGVSGVVPALARFGWCGVDLFFVLSGFLITGILYDSKESAGYFRNFYMRRVLRIFPLYYGVLVAFTLVALMAGRATVMTGTGVDRLGLWLYAQNFIIAIKGWGTYGSLDHFWSLAIEEHFYLVWPLLVFLFNRRTLMWILVGASVAALALRKGLVMEGVGEESLYILTPGGFDARAIGSLRALRMRGPGGLERWARGAKWAGAAAVACLAAMALWRGGLSHEDPMMETAGFSLLAVASAGLLVVGLAAPRERWVGRGLTARPLRWMGKYSYGLYVLHPPIFIAVMHTSLGREWVGREGWGSLAVAVALSLGLTMVAVLLSWHLMEKQFLKLKRHFR